MLQGQWRRNLSSSAGSAQLRPNFWKILRRFPIQLSTTKLAGCLLLTPIHPNKRANTHTYRRNNSLRGSTDIGHKSKGFLKKLPINRRVNSVQWAFSPPPRTLKFLNSPEKKKRVRPVLALSRMPLASEIDINRGRYRCVFPFRGGSRRKRAL